MKGMTSGNSTLIPWFLALSTTCGFLASHAVAMSCPETSGT